METLKEDRFSRFSVPLIIWEYTCKSAFIWSMAAAHLGVTVPSIAFRGLGWPQRAGYQRVVELGRGPEMKTQRP